MAGRAQRLKLRLFLEGVEVPVIGVQIVGLPNSPLMASIQIPPVPEGTRLLPRTLVHLFFNDFYEADSPHITATKSLDSETAKDPTAYEQQRRRSSENNGEVGSLDDDTANELYKLLFMGEILGFQWSKNESNRSLVLQCADLSNYWDYAYQWVNTGLFGPGIKALFSGGSTNLFTDFLSTEAETLTRILMRPSILFPNLKGLAGGIIHLLEAIGGSYHTAKKLAGQNIFFTIAELRLHIMQMVCAYEDDPTATRLLARQGFGGLFNRLLGGMGRQTSIRQSINALQGIIFHEMYAQPCPAYEPGTSGTIKGRVEKKLIEDPATANIATKAILLRQSIADIRQQVRVKDEWPDVAAKAAKDRTSLGALKNTMLIILVGMRKSLQEMLIQLRKVKVPAADGLIKSAGLSILRATALIRRWQPSDDKLISQIEAHLDEADDKLARLGNITINKTDSKDVRPARINQQIFRPDVWFSAPPRCNVIFPEQYHELQYARSFMEEPTRLLLKTNDEFFGEDELFDRFYFAPKTRSVKKSKVDLQTLLRNDLLEHEILTGILPVFEKMGELNIFAARGGVVKDKAQNVGLAQRSANFIYFKYRFAARQMTLRGRFNPYIAMGFPGVIIDKYVDVETLRLHNELLQKAGRPTRDINKLLGTNFLGNFTQVTHTVNQTQGATELVVSYPRQPEESVEFLGATDKEVVQINKRFDEPAFRTTDIAALFPPRLMSLGPNLGRITKVIEVTDLYNTSLDGLLADENTVSSEPLLLFGGDATRKPRAAKDRVVASVPVGFSIDANKLDPKIRKELGIEKGKDIFGIPPESNFPFTIIEDGPRSRVVKTPRPVTIRAFRVEEEVPRFKQEEVELPAEEYIRPGWYGDIWHPANIGKAYNTFFKTGSITDQHTVSGDGAIAPIASDINKDALVEGLGAQDPDDENNDAPIFTLQEGASIEQAVAFLVSTYSYIRQQGLDTEEFIRAYNWRPIASMVDIFGTSDLRLSDDGTEVLQGVEGFHSKAFGQFNDLFGLVTSEIEEVVGLKRNTTAAEKGDTRKLKQDAVLELISALNFRALLG